MEREIKLELRFPEKVEVRLSLPEGIEEMVKIYEKEEVKKPVFYEPRPFYERKPLFEGALTERRRLHPLEPGYSLERAKEIAETLYPVLKKALEHLKKIIEERRKAKEMAKKGEEIKKSEEVEKSKFVSAI